MKTRVTDLDEFSLDHVWRPYWPTWLDMHGETWDQSSRLAEPLMGLIETAEELAKPSKWSDQVIGRLARIGVQFPSWVMHELVDVVLERIDEVNGVDRSKAGIPMGLSMYTDETKRLRGLLDEGSDLMDQLLLDVGSERPVVGPDGVNAWRRKAGIL